MLCGGTEKGNCYLLIALFEFRSHAHFLSDADIVFSAADRKDISLPATDFFFDELDRLDMKSNLLHWASVVIDSITNYHKNKA